MVPNRATHQSSTHDPRLLSYSTLFKDAQSGDGIPKKSKSLGDFGETPLVTIGDTAGITAWNGFLNGSMNIRATSKFAITIRVVIENTYGILKGR